MSDLENKLFTIKINPDSNPHLYPVQEECLLCQSKICTVICPAGVYEWDGKKLIVKFENCLECGACRISCERCSLGWEYPKGNKGVTFRHG